MEKGSQVYEQTRTHFADNPILGKTTIRAVANLLEDMHIEARVGKFHLESDEPAVRGGTDLGPTPLQYFVAGAAFCLITQLARPSMMSPSKSCRPMSAPNSTRPTSSLRIAATVPSSRSLTPSREKCPTRILCMQDIAQPSVCLPHRSRDWNAWMILISSHLDTNQQLFGREWGFSPTRLHLIIVLTTPNLLRSKNWFNILFSRKCSSKHFMTEK